MKRILDQLTLLVYCLLLLSFQQFYNVYLVAFLVVLIYICLNFYLSSDRLLTVSAICLAAAMIIHPEFSIFLPVVLYNVVEDKNYVLAAVLVAVGIFQALPGGITFLMFLLVGCLLCVLLNQRTGEYEALDFNFRKMQDDSREKNMLLKEKNQTLLEKQDYEVYTATLRERNRIAREIHDNVGHMLSRSILMVGALKTLNKDKDTAEPLLRLDDTLNEAMTSIRRSVHDLHDDSVNLKDIIMDLADTFTFCSINVDYDMGYDIPREVKYCFIAIAREALNNVMKHSDATKVVMTLREHPGMYQMVVEDNGATGAYVEEPMGMTTSGMGLQNMRDRVEKLSGMLNIQTEKGFRIYIVAPKKEGQV